MPLEITEPAEQLFTVEQMAKAIDNAKAEAGVPLLKQITELQGKLNIKTSDCEQVQSQWLEAKAEVARLKALTSEQAATCAAQKTIVDAVMAATATHRVAALNAAKAKIDAELATLQA